MNDGNEVYGPELGKQRPVERNFREPVEPSTQRKNFPFLSDILCIRQSEAVTILRDKGHVEHKDEAREELKAELLLENSKPCTDARSVIWTHGWDFGTPGTARKQRRS